MLELEDCNLVRSPCLRGELSAGLRGAKPTKLMFQILGQICHFLRTINGINRMN